jgi:hypothetical protein
MPSTSQFALQRIADIAAGRDHPGMHPKLALRKIQRIAEDEIAANSPALNGVKVRLDPILPANTAEIRGVDGKLLWRIG